MVTSAAVALISTTLFGCFYRMWWRCRKNKVGPNNLIIITGCDSGLGYSLAVHCHNKLNMFVVACVLKRDSEGAKQLVELDTSKNRLILIELDLTDRNKIAQVHQQCKQYLQMNKHLELTAIVNNAGIMCFGEFEWQTERMIQNQIDTNLIGTMNFTRRFLPLARQHKSRIINVTSHCALQALPALSVYAATKVGLRFWTDALRMEVKPYGIKVVNFIPGNLIMETKIMHRQLEYAKEMLREFDEEQEKFYGDYFERFNNHLKFVPCNAPTKLINDKKLITKFENSLLHTNPKPLYKHEPLRYTFNHMLYRIAPASFRDYIVIKLMKLPKYKI